MSFNFEKEGDRLQVLTISVFVLLFFLIVGHFAREVSQINKFILDQAAKVIATLTSTNFRSTPLVQGLEIACKVTVKMPATIKNHDFGSIQRVGKRLLHGT